MYYVEFKITNSILKLYSPKYGEDVLRFIHTFQMHLENVIISYRTEKKKLNVIRGHGVETLQKKIETKNVMFVKRILKKIKK